jgi:hypothetical protein
VTTLVKDQVPIPKWPWIGPEGYDENMYTFDRYKNTPIIGDGAKGILALGVPHGRLIGYISPMGHNLSYDDTFDKREILELGSVTGTTKVKADRDGMLWLAVNDGGKYIHDNLGYFVVSVSIE